MSPIPEDPAEIGDVDLRGIPFEPGQEIVYARKTTSGDIVLQQAIIEKVNREERMYRWACWLQVRKPDGKKRKLTRLDRIVILD